MRKKIKKKQTSNKISGLELLFSLVFYKQIQIYARFIYLKQFVIFTKLQ